jgi:hypothetical protein
MKYRKKPVVIEAEQFVCNPREGEDWNGIVAKMSAEFGAAICMERHFDNAVLVTEAGHIHTLEGAHQVNCGDWIIKGVKGEFYPCKPDIFALTYEEVSAPADETHPDVYSKTTADGARGMERGVKMNNWIDTDK